MMLVFLDSSVFIWGYNRTNSNSAKTLELMNEGKIRVVISEKVVKELRIYFLKFYNKDIFSEILYHITSTAIIIPKEEILGEIKKLKNKIKEKDIEHLATVRYMNIKYLIAYDEDFEIFEEYITPKNFIKKLDLKTSDTDY